MGGGLSKIGCGLSRLLDYDQRGYKPLRNSSRKRRERQEREERRARRQARKRRHEARKRRRANRKRVEALKTARRKDWDTFRANRRMTADGAWVF